MKRIRTAAVVATAAVSMLTAAPAHAEDSAVTVTVTAGALSISVPASSDLGSGGPGDAISGQLGSVTVTDGRAALDASWTATVTSTDFTTGGGTPAETVPSSDIAYWSGLATATSGTGTFTPGQATAGGAQDLSAARTAFTHTAGTGNNSASWNPTLVVSPSVSAVAGVYTGTVTHSVE